MLQLSQGLHVADVRLLQTQENSIAAGSAMLAAPDSMLAKQDLQGAKLHFVTTWTTSCKLHAWNSLLQHDWQ
jgi:hypothetical protein